MSIPPVNPDGQSLDYYPPKSAWDHVVNQGQSSSHNGQPRHAQKPVKQARDRAQYVRNQRGHSWLFAWIILGPITCFIVPIYWTVSPNHYFHV